MAKASGSRGSRSERKAGRQRAERARAHGLPAARPPQPADRPPGVDGVPELADVVPAAATRTHKSRPVLVWVLGGALMLLVIAYVVTKFRDNASP